MLSYLVSPSFGSSSAEVAGDRGVSEDLISAEIIQSEADEGCPRAQAFISDGRLMLGAASIHAARSARVRKGAMKASRMGYHGLARMGMDAARCEDGQATSYTSQLAGAVRRAHSGAFGYVTPEEIRQQRRNLYLEGLSASQREGVLNQLLDRVMQTSVNYGAEGSSVEEVGDDSLDQISAAVSCYGADLDVVFGADVYKKIGRALRPAVTKLQERLDKIEARIDKLEAKGADAEKVEDAVDKRQKIKDKIDEAEDVAEAVEEAEQASDEMGGIEAGALIDDPKAEMVGMDEVLIFAAEHFGMSEQRRLKIERRIERLQRRLEALEDKGAPKKKLVSIRARIRRLEATLEDAEEGKISEDSLPDSLVTKQPKAYSRDEFVQSFFGGDHDERRAFVGYFTRRAESMGVAVPSLHAAFGTTTADDKRRSIREFFEDVGLAAQGAFNPEVRTALRSAREKARKAFQVNEKRQALMVARLNYLQAVERSREYVREMGRYVRGRLRGEHVSKPALPGPSSAPTSRGRLAVVDVSAGDYANMPGGYAYSVQDNGDLFITVDPRNPSATPRKVSAESRAGQAILKQISENPKNLVSS